MKSNEINAIYAAKVTEFLTAGYTINTNTMDGSQGEIAKIDFRNGDEVIRILLHKETIWGEHFRTADAVVLTVGRCTDERVINTKGFNRDAIIWNNQLEVIEERTFYQIGERWGNSDWYLEGEEAEKALKKHSDRTHLRYSMEREEEKRQRKEYSDDNAKKIVLPAVRRHLGKPNMKLNRIATIVRRWEKDHFEYTVTTVGKNRVVLH